MEEMGQQIQCAQGHRSVSFMKPMRKLPITHSEGCFRPGASHLLCHLDIDCHSGERVPLKAVLCVGHGSHSPNSLVIHVGP